MGSQPFAALETHGHEHGQKGKARLAGALEQLRWRAEHYVLPALL